MQKGMRLNDGHVAYLGLLAKKDGSRRGYLSKRSGDNTKWQSKWFALLQNMLFCFESDSSSRPSGLYLLEGSACDRAPSLPAKDSLEKQVGAARGAGRPVRGLPRAAPLGAPEPGSWRGATQGTGQRGLRWAGRGPLLGSARQGPPGAGNRRGQAAPEPWDIVCNPVFACNRARVQYSACAIEFMHHSVRTCNSVHVRVQYSVCTCAIQCMRAIKCNSVHAV
uniref:PH domain-containing protein n=1 Tax=Gopherus agassizii TaxID=38772 RepID=A0A452H1G9_9SAUR